MVRSIISLTMKQLHYRLFVVTLALVIAVTSVPPVYADDAYRNNNDIVWVNPDAGTGECTTGASSTSTETISTDGKLPASTLLQLGGGPWKQLADKNKAAYQAGEKASGIPWAVIATVHYREASMNPKQSIANGQPITGKRYTSIDGQPIGATLAEDAEIAAKKFKKIANNVYGVNLTLNSTIEDWGKAYLAYNRGFMYKEANEPYTKSPYVMNGYDMNHLNMKWIRADSWFKGKKYNSLEGQTERRPGALAMLAYLGGPVGSGGSENCSGSASGVKQDDIVETAKGLAWDSPVPRQSSPWSSKARPEFVTALKKYNASLAGNESNYADCGVFVSTVMRASGVDPDFPPISTGVMKPYLEKSPKYKVNTRPTLESLKPGDILIVHGGGGQHIEIYTGEIGKKDGQALVMVDASLRQRTPSYRTQGDLKWMLGRPGVISATFVGGQAS